MPRRGFAPPRDDRGGRETPRRFFITRIPARTAAQIAALLRSVLVIAKQKRTDCHVGALPLLAMTGVGGRYCAGFSSRVFPPMTAAQIAALIKSTLVIAKQKDGLPRQGFAPPRNDRGGRTRRADFSSCVFSPMTAVQIAASLKIYACHCQTKENGLPRRGFAPPRNDRGGCETPRQFFIMRIPINGGS